VFALTVGVLAVAQARTVVGFVGEALAFERSGGAIQTVALAGAIDGAQCDAVASLPGIVAAGALRAGPEIVLAQLPSTSISSLEVTVGFGRLLDLRRTGGAWGDGMWVSQDLADGIGLTLDHPQVPLANGDTLAVDGIYDYPNDGRSPTLIYQILSPAPAVDLFDECWELVWPDPDLAIPVLTLPVIPDFSGAEQTRVTVGQVNTTLGASFDGPARFAALPLGAMRLAGVGVAGVAGFVSVRSRRLELASALHAGVAKTALALQVTVETAWWLLLGLTPSVATAVYAARAGNTTEWFTAFFPAAQTLAAAGATAILGALAATALTRETHLFRYFKNR
jgi:hypothetical protein